MIFLSASVNFDLFKMIEIMKNLFWKHWVCKWFLKFSGDHFVFIFVLWKKMMTSKVFSTALTFGMKLGKFQKN